MQSLLSTATGRPERIQALNSFLSPCRRKRLVTAFAWWHPPFVTNPGPASNASPRSMLAKASIGPRRHCSNSRTASKPRLPAPLRPLRPADGQAEGSSDRHVNAASWSSGNALSRNAAHLRAQTAPTVVVAMQCRPSISEGRQALARSPYFVIASILFWGALGWLLYSLWVLPF